ncbi:MAG: PTS sugar transporter subunit IIA [gamma proteobacterium symbiont of Bathyaustriella thionipta]|nr:PTS sugar transporter subunit IIA [gamma proteobacterium symbiont of Bathyaustriella thionipta]
MLPEQLLIPASISLQAEARSKKRALEMLSGLLFQHQPADASEEETQAVSSEIIFEKLLQRERLGSTGLGHGIALPHARISGLQQAVGAFLLLAEGIDFDAIDRQPVDMLFALLVPEQATDEHLRLLASLAGLFKQESICQQLRQAHDNEAVISILGSNTAVAAAPS